MSQNDTNKIKDEDVIAVSKVNMDYLENILAAFDHKASSLKMGLNSGLAMLKEYGDQQSPEDRRESFNLLIETANQLSDIIETARSLVKNYDSEDTSIEDLENLGEEISDLCKTRFNNHRIILNNSLNNHVSIECRKNQFIQAIFAILNASHDAVAGSQDKWIKLSDQMKNNSVEIQIVDSGPVVEESPEEVFHLEYNKNGRKGYNFLIAKEIIEKSGGIFSFRNENGQTVFTINIPR